MPLAAGDLAALLKPHPSVLSLCEEGGGGGRSRICSSSATVEETSNLKQEMNDDIKISMGTFTTVTWR